jgi:hypothetical protein
MFKGSTHDCDSFCTGTPVLNQVQPDPRSPYTDTEWEAMLGYKYEDDCDHTLVRKDYAQAMGELGNRDLQFAPYHAPPTQIMQAPAQKPQQKKKTVAALASWCGFSKKAMSAHKQFGVQDKVQELYCDKQDKNHPLCKQTKGYPTYYTSEGSVLKRGFPVQDPAGFYRSL